MQSFELTTSYWHYMSPTERKRDKINGKANLDTSNISGKLKWSSDAVRDFWRGTDFISRKDEWVAGVL